MGIMSFSKKVRGASPKSLSSPWAHQNPLFHLTSYSEPNLPSAYQNNRDQGNKPKACNQDYQHTRLPLTTLPHRTDSSHDAKHSDIQRLDASTTKRPSTIKLKVSSSSSQPADLKKGFYRSTRPPSRLYVRADQGLGELDELDRLEAETEQVYTACQAAQDSRAGACLVAWPPAHYPTPPIHVATPMMSQRTTGHSDDDLDYEQRKGEKSDEAKTGPYVALEAALDARRGACFVAWPMDEEWRVPTLCV